jgi:hypothetical protein
MTVDDFKRDHPNLAHLEGDELWDAMTSVGYHKQQGEAIITQIKPLWNQYRLRWLFYRKVANVMFGKNDYTAYNRCASCKKGVSSYVGFMFNGRIVSSCPHCGVELVKELNTGISHKLYVVWCGVSDLFWKVLDWLHLVRSGKRYGMLGDESYYVKHWSYDINTGETGYELKKRRWFEYVFIKRW